MNIMVYSYIFPLELYDGGSDFRLNGDYNLKFSSVGRCLMFVIGWGYRGSTRGFLKL